MQNLHISSQLVQTLSLKRLHFSDNFNNKLDCKSFSTVRLFNSDKYIMLDLFEITLKGKKDKPRFIKGIARLQYVTKFKLDKVTPGMSFLDANMGVLDFQLLMVDLYKNKRINFKKDFLSFLVFQYLQPYEIHDLISES